MVKFTKKQKALIDTLEMTMVELVHDQKTRLAKSLEPIVEMLQQGNSVCAVLEAQASGLDDRIVSEIRNVFDVRF